MIEISLDGEVLVRLENDMQMIDSVLLDLLALWRADKSSATLRYMINKLREYGPAEYQVQPKMNQLQLL